MNVYCKLHVNSFLSLFKQLVKKYETYIQGLIHEKA